MIFGVNCYLDKRPNCTFLLYRYIYIPLKREFFPCCTGESVIAADPLPFGIIAIINVGRALVGGTRAMHHLLVIVIIHGHIDLVVPGHGTGDIVFEIPRIHPLTGHAFQSICPRIVQILTAQGLTIEPVGVLPDSSEYSPIGGICISRQRIASDKIALDSFQLKPVHFVVGKAQSVTIEFQTGAVARDIRGNVSIVITRGKAQRIQGRVVIGKRQGKVIAVAGRRKGHGAVVDARQPPQIIVPA